MKIRTDREESGVALEVTAPEDQQEHLLERLQCCWLGICPRPTGAEEKVESVHIDPTEEGMTLHFRARAGSDLTPAEIEAWVLAAND